MSQRAPSAAKVPRGRADASDRILQAAADGLVASGAVALTMSDVADLAGVSKGLIHYHFHDKETLLARLADWMSTGVAQRERAALEHSAPAAAIDDLWRCVDQELALGHVRALVELASWRGERVRQAVVNGAAARRESTSECVDRLFTLLALRPRIPSALLADVVIAFVDGLAVTAPLDPAVNPRAAFDIFWLSLLGLAD